MVRYREERIRVRAHQSHSEGERTKDLTEAERRRLSSVYTKLGLYHAGQSAKTMARVGHESGRSYLQVARELNLEAVRLRRTNPTKSEAFKRGANEAFKLHAETGR